MPSSFVEPHDPSEKNVLPAAELRDVILPIALETTRSLALQMQSFDGMLWEIDQLLNDLQPPLTGKIRFWQPKDDDFQRFIPIIWRRSKADNKWKFDKRGWAFLTLRVMKAREFSDNYDLVFSLVALGCEIQKARAGLLLAFTNFTQSGTQRLKHAVPNGTKWRKKIEAVTIDRDAGKFRTWITKHNPPRDPS
jgi:hypothetical protein